MTKRELKQKISNVSNDRHKRKPDIEVYPYLGNNKSTKTKTKTKRV